MTSNPKPDQIPKLTLHFLSLFSVFTTNPVGPVWCSRYTVAPWSSSIVLLTLSGHDRRQLLALAIFSTLSNQTPHNYSKTQRRISITGTMRNTRFMFGFTLGSHQNFLFLPQLANAPAERLRVRMESEVLASRFKDSDTVELTPFRHQVGGHFAIMNFDELRLAKPAVPREIFFYQTAPKEVCTFIPRYHGEVSMSLVNVVQFLLVTICPQRHALPPPSLVSPQPSKVIATHFCPH